MAVENGPVGGLTENEDVRRRALMRLTVAGLVTVAALGGLWWLDQGARKPEKPVSVAPPSPIVTAPPQEIAPPRTAGEEPAPAAKEASTQERGEPPPAATAKPPTTPEPPPPPKVSNAPKILGAPAAIPRAALSSHSPGQPRNGLAPSGGGASAFSESGAVPTRPAATQAAPLGERFVVQLAVFSNPERARELVSKLNKQGIRAHMETRVHLGPFANREEAEKAQAEMRKMGMQALVTPAFATK